MILLLKLCLSKLCLFISCQITGQSEHATHNRVISQELQDYVKKCASELYAQAKPTILWESILKSSQHSKYNQRWNESIMGNLCKSQKVYFLPKFSVLLWRPSSVAERERMREQLMEQLREQEEKEGEEEQWKEAKVTVREILHKELRRAGPPLFIHCPFDGKPHSTQVSWRKRRYPCIYDVVRPCGPSQWLLQGWSPHLG